MLIAKKRGNNALAFVRDESNCIWYSIVLQNTLTKEITMYIAEDIGNEFYHKFNIDIDVEDGEYYTLLFENPNKLNFYTPANAPKDIDYIEFLVNEDQLIMNGKYYLVFSGGEKSLDNIKFLHSDMFRMGEYTRKTTQYQKEQQYIQYNK